MPLQPTLSPSRQQSRPPLWLKVAALVAVSWALIFTFLLPSGGPWSTTPPPEAGIAPQAQIAHLQAIDRLIPVNALRADGIDPSAAPRVVRWVDASGKVGIREARARLLTGEFKPIALPRSDGFNKQAYWYAMHWRRADATQNRWLLAVGQPYLDDVRVYVERASGQVERYQMGDHFLAQGRPVDARWHVVGVNLAPQEDVVVWVRVASGGILSTEILIDTPAHYVSKELSTSAVLGVFMGILLLAVFTYLSVSAWLRDGMLLAYAAFLASLFMLHMGQNGLLIQLAGTPPWWLNDLFAGFGSLGPWYAGNALWALALNLRREHPRLHVLYVASAVFFLMGLPLAFTPYYGLLSQISFLLGLCMSPLTLTLTWLGWRRERDSLSLTYLAAVLAYLTGTYVSLLHLLGLLPMNAITQSTQPVCTLVHTLIMGVALAMRIGRIRLDQVQAQEHTQAYRRFVAMLTHEFRNPLASIDRSANVIQALHANGPAPEQARVANIRQQARRLSTLVDSFLLVRDDGALPTQPQPTRVQLRTWLESLHQALGPDMAARIKLTLPPAHAEVMLDPRLMQLALNNLLDNALRYSPDEAQVQLQARLNSPSGCEIVVIDQGPGLDAATLAQLGQPYYRGHNAIGGQGTGLGYYFCRQLVEAHGGTLTPTAAQPCGLCVTVRLP